MAKKATDVTGAPVPPPPPAPEPGTIKPSWEQPAAGQSPAAETSSSTPAASTAPDAIQEPSVGVGAPTLEPPDAAFTSTSGATPAEEQDSAEKQQAGSETSAEESAPPEPSAPPPPPEPAKAAPAAKQPELVLMHVPKPFRLSLDDGRRLRFNVGPHRVEKAIANHWYCKANGAKVIKGG